MSAAPPSPIDPMPWWSTAWTIERWRQRQGWNAILRARKGDRLRRWSSLIGRILWPIMVTWLSWITCSSLRASEELGDTLAQYLLGMLSLFTFLILLVSAIKFAYQTFFSAPDLPLLQSLPLAPRGIFVAKYLDNLAFSNHLVTLFAVGPWLGYALAFGWPPERVILALLALWFLPVYTTALGIGISLIVSRLVPQARMRETLMLGSMAASIAFYIAMRTAVSRDVSPGVHLDPGAFLWTWLPTTWLATWALDLHPEEGSTPLLLFFFLGSVLFVASAWLGDRAYLWGVTHFERDGGTQGAAGTPWLLRGRTAPSASRAFWFKDLMTFARDPRQWYYLVFFALLFFMQVDPAGPGTAADGLAHLMVQTVSNAFILVFMSTMALQELTVLGVSREGARRWLLHAQPLTPVAILWGKFATVLVFTVLLAVLGGIAEVAIGHLAWSEFAGTVIGSIIIASSINWAFLSLGARWPDFEGYQQRQRVSPILALAIAVVDGFVLTVLLFSATLLASYDQWAPWLNRIADVSYNTVVVGATAAMVVTLFGLWAGGLWNGYTAVKRLLQEN